MSLPNIKNALTRFQNRIFFQIQSKCAPNDERLWLKQSDEDLANYMMQEAEKLATAKTRDEIVEICSRVGAGAMCLSDKLISLAPNRRSRLSEEVQQTFPEMTEEESSNDEEQ